MESTRKKPNFILFLFLVGCIAKSSCKSRILVVIENTGETFTVQLSLRNPQNGQYKIDFKKVNDPIFAENFVFEIFDGSNSTETTFPHVKDTQDEMYVNDEFFAAVQFKKLENDDDGAPKYAMSGVIGDMIITFNERKQAHYFTSSNLETFDAKKSFHDFERYRTPHSYTFAPFHIRLLIVLDTPIYNKLVQKFPTPCAMKGYLSVLFTSVRTRLRITTNKSFNIVISKIIALEDCEFFPESRVSSQDPKTKEPVYKIHETLCGFAQWVYNTNEVGNQNLATFITDRNFEAENQHSCAGYSFLSGAGTVGTLMKLPVAYMGSTLVTHKGKFDAMHVFVHEFLHSFGATHEHAENSLMAEDIGNAINFVLGSPNVDIIQKFPKTKAAERFTGSVPFAGKYVKRDISGQFRL